MKEIARRGPKVKPFELKVVPVSTTGTNGDIEVCGGTLAVADLLREHLRLTASNIRKSKS